MQKLQTKQTGPRPKRNTKRARVHGAPVLSRDVNDTATYAGVGRSAIREAIKAGQLKARKLGRRTLVLDENTRAWIAGLPVV